MDDIDSLFSNFKIYEIINSLLN